MRLKAVYPSKCMDGWKKFEETSLPPKDAFYSRLNMKGISDFFIYLFFYNNDDHNLQTNN